MSLTNDDGNEHGSGTAGATADAGGEGAPDSSLPPSGPRWYEADFEAFPDDKVPKDVQECFLNRNLRCEGGTATAYSRCMALAIGMDCEQVHTFTLADLARSRFVKEGATQEMALALLRNIVRFNGGAADRRQGLQDSSLALLVGDNERALKLSAVHPTVDILEAALAALRKKRETTPPIDEGRHAALARTPGYTSAFSPDHLADVLTDALGGTSRKTLGFDDTDRSLYQVKVTSGELTGILDELYRSGAVTRPELAEHHVSPSTVKKLLQLFGHSTDHPARLETHAVLPYTSVRVGPAPGAKISDKAVDAWSAHHHHIAIVCFLHAVEAVGLHKDIPAAQGVHPAPVRGEKFSKGIIFPNLVQATFKERSQFYAALQDTMALHFREYGRLEPTYQACLDLIAQKRRDILLRPPPVAGAAVPDATRVAGSQDDAKKGQKRGQSEAGAKTAPPGAKPTGEYASKRAFKRAEAAQRVPGAPAHHAPLAATPPHAPRSQQGYAQPPPWYHPPTPFYPHSPMMAPPPGYPPMAPVPPAGPPPPRAPLAACFDFARGACTRGAACKFSHNPAA